MELKDLYRQLTAVDIDEQRQLWDERGKGYYGEYLLFCELYQQVPGMCKILMNLRIPVNASHTTEIDLLLIHETGLYVFEVKHYKGVIYGKDTDSVWTQYFRTSQNHTFSNPVGQNGYHIYALKNLFPNLPIRSCIVFTSSECDLRVYNSNPEVDICLFRNLGRTLAYRFQTNRPVLSMEAIDQIFHQLSACSPMEGPPMIDRPTADFLTWVQPTLWRLEQTKAQLEQEKANWVCAEKELERKRRNGLFGNIAAAVACVLLSAAAVLMIYQGYALEPQKNDAELSAFKQNFLHVDEIGNPYIDALNSFVEVSNVSITPLSEDAVSFTARIAMTNDVYGMALMENSKYLVMTKAGKVFEYDVFGEHLKYNRFANMLGEGIRSYGDLAPAQFYGVSEEELSYIKITGIELFKLDTGRTTVKTDLELELYSK